MRDDLRVAESRPFDDRNIPDEVKVVELRIAIVVARNMTAVERDVDQISALIGFAMHHAFGAMKRLMDVAEEVDEKYERFLARVRRCFRVREHVARLFDARNDAGGALAIAVG